MPRGACPTCRYPMVTRGHNCGASGHWDLASQGVPGSPVPQGGGLSARLSQSHCNLSLSISLLSLGLHFDSLSKPVSAPLPALTPGLSPFLPAGPPPPVAPPLLGCCGNSVCSLAEAQQELQVLRRQLGESEHAASWLGFGTACPACCAVTHHPPPSLTCMSCP